MKTAQQVLFLMLLLISAYTTQAQEARKHHNSVNDKPMTIVVDDNYTGSFSDLENKEVEIHGTLLFWGVNEKEPNEYIVNTARGAFTITNWGPIWHKKKVKIFGNVTVMKKNYPQPVPMMPTREKYLITIKRIELIDE